MGIPRPLKTRRILWSAALEQIGTALPLVVGVPVVIEKVCNLSPTTVALLTFVLIALVIAIQYVLAIIRKRNETSTSELEGSLHTLYEILWPAEHSDEFRLRTTIHVPVGKDRLEQLLNYVGDDSNTKTAGRRFAAQSGVIGRAFRTKKPVSAKRSSLDHAGYINELIENWHYTSQDARRLNPATMSWVAIPIMTKDAMEVQAILYVDCTEPRFFGRSRVRVIEAAAVGIAKFIKIHYNNDHKS